MQPIPQVLQWFVEHGSRLRHVAVTAVPLSAAHLSAAWVIRHFGRWIRSFHFIPSPREGDLPPYDRSKGEALRQWGTIDAFIDDNPDNLASAERFGIRTFCFPRPWNQGFESGGDARRVDNNGVIVLGTRRVPYGELRHICEYTENCPKT